ncbi:hypothetical protein K1T71_008065 [Dendrolimus kikuchii]|uniref:Uncharacterized protein n=1 Tax=Dendrolimus kikuchii TaxID=765133 RepID=A0ACC1CZ75_9NEOP|nr:hypothetical protein K1T71_008065 [Dendrolimus kikuchii]
MAKSETRITDFSYDKVPTKEILSEKEVPSDFGYGVRHIQLVIFLMCMSVSFIARGHLGVTIVAMADIANTDTEINTRNETHFEVTGTLIDFSKDFDNIAKSSDWINDTSFKYFNESNKNIDDIKEASSESIWNVNRSYNWSKPYQEMILSAFFLGYCIMMFPIGMVCQRWGGKLPYQISLFTNGVLSIITPWAAAWGGWKAVCACRIAQGMSQAGTFPGTQSLLARWVPRNERATWGSYVYAGSMIGNVIALQLGGLLADSRWGWPTTYWVVGLLCITAATVLTIFGTASPAENKFISEEERYYILSGIDGGGVKVQKVPWRAILRSKHVWATICTHFGSSTIFVFFFTQVPSYIHYIYSIDVKSSGLLSSLPYLASLFTSIAFGLISDYFTNRGILTPKTARRLSNSISQVGIGVSLILASVASSSVIAVTCLVFAMGCHMGIHTGWMINQIDLAPNYSGTLMALGNTITSILLQLLPVAVSHIIVDVKNQHQWQIVFGMMAALAIITNTIFVIFLSTDTQPWNDCHGDVKHTLNLILNVSGIEPVTEKSEHVKE